jgi:L-lactate dehydrogenase
MIHNHVWTHRKVAIVGAGAVGSTFAYALAQSGLAAEIALVDQNTDLMQGQVLDLLHGLPFFPAVEIHTGSPRDYADSQVIVVTAGSKQRPGESRLELLQRNSSIMEGIVDEILGEGSQAILLVVSNPVDVLTYVALKRSGWEKRRVFGSGTVLDSARFRYLLSRHCNIDVHNVHAYILGEHGDSEFAAWSMTHVAGMQIDEYCPYCKDCGNWEEERAAIVDEVRISAYHIIDYKGATYFAVGLALVKIVGAILRNEHSLLTVSTLLDGEYGLASVCLSVPCLVSEVGVERIIEAKLSPQEQEALSHSSSVLRGALDGLGLGG